MTTPELIAAGELIRKYDANPPQTISETVERMAALRTVLSSSPPIHYTSFARIQPRAVRWLWPGQIPLGKLTLLAGDPGIGKSLLTLDIAARLSRSLPWPESQASGAQTSDSQASGSQTPGARASGSQASDFRNSRPPSSVLQSPSSIFHPPSSSDPQLSTLHPQPSDTILLNGEDDLSDTLRPRLEAAGADLARIHFVQQVRNEELEWHPWTLDDIPQLEAMIDKLPNVRLVIIDPLAAFVERSARHAGEVRSILAPLARLAARKGVAIVAVTHLRKATAGRALYRCAGSLAFTALPRAVSVVTRDPADPVRRLFLPVKQNLAAESAGLAFRIVDQRIEWEQAEVRINADQALNTDLGPEDSDPTAVERAARWLMEMLADGPQPARTLRHAALDCGISHSGLRRAKDLLGVSIVKGPGGTWLWHPPGQQTLTG